MLGYQWPGIVIAINDVLVHWPRHVHHATSLHPEKLMMRDPSNKQKRPWVEQRARNGFNTDYITWGRDPARRFGLGRHIEPWGGGASGMLAVAIAHELKCPKAILCGVPMTKEPHFVESGVHFQNEPWAFADSHWRVWLQKEERMRGWVKSMSGRTRELLGAPDLAWLGT